MCRSRCLPAAQGCDDALRAKPVQAFFGSHGVLEHVQADGAHKLAVQATWGDSNLRPISESLLAER